MNCTAFVSARDIGTFSAVPIRTFTHWLQKLPIYLKICPHSGTQWYGGNYTMIWVLCHICSYPGVFSGEWSTLLDTTWTQKMMSPLFWRCQCFWVNMNRSVKEFPNMLCVIFCPSQEEKDHHVSVFPGEWIILLHTTLNTMFQLISSFITLLSYG